MNRCAVAFPPLSHTTIYELTFFVVIGSFVVVFFLTKDLSFQFSFHSCSCFHPSGYPYSIFVGETFLFRVQNNSPLFNSLSLLLFHSHIRSLVVF